MHDMHNYITLPISRNIRENNILVNSRIPYLARTVIEMIIDFCWYDNTAYRHMKSYALYAMQ